jgi:hypothetical protein
LGQLISICTLCHKDYTQQKPRQTVCSIPCAILASRATQRVAFEKKRRKADKARKEALKSMSQLSADAQVQFNKYIRVRDGQTCISCNKPPGDWQAQAGHFRPRGGLGSHLRFHTGNCYSQCVSCNLHLSANLTPFRAALVELRGEDFVLSLENNNKPVTFSREYLLRVRRIFARRAKHLSKLRERAISEGF